jgi:hypothetical protein
VAVEGMTAGAVVDTADVDGTVDTETASDFEFRIADVAVDAGGSVPEVVGAVSAGVVGCRTIVASRTTDPSLCATRNGSPSAATPHAIAMTRPDRSLLGARRSG